MHSGPHHLSYPPPLIDAPQEQRNAAQKLVATTQASLDQVSDRGQELSTALDAAQQLLEKTQG